MTGEQFVQILKQQVDQNTLNAAKKVGLKLFAYPDRIGVRWDVGGEQVYELSQNGAAQLAGDIQKGVGHTTPAQTKLAGEPGGRQRSGPYSDPDD